MTTPLTTGAATPFNLDIVQGATYRFSVTYTTGGATPTPSSLAGYRAHMQIRRRPGTTILVDLASTGTSPAIQVEPSSQTGVVSVRIPATLTATLSRDGVYDLFLINETDATEAFRLLYGNVTVEQAVTQS